MIVHVCVVKFSSILELSVFLLINGFWFHSTMVQDYAQNDVDLKIIKNLFCDLTCDLCWSVFEKNVSFFVFLVYVFGFIAIGGTFSTCPQVCFVSSAVQVSCY